MCTHIAYTYCMCMVNANTILSTWLAHKETECRMNVLCNAIELHIHLNTRCELHIKQCYNIIEGEKLI